MITSSLQPQMLVNYIKYDTLQKMIVDNYSGSRATRVNLFIDINSLLNSLYIDKNSNLNALELISLVFNLVPHYKAFFRKLDVVCVPFLVHSDIQLSSVNHMLCREYRVSNPRYRNDDLGNKIVYIINELKALFLYVQDAYFKSYNVEFSTVVRSIMSMSNNSTANIVITKDPYAYQLANYGCLVIRPKSNDGGFYINRNNLYKIIFDKDISFNSELLTLLWSISRMPERNFKSIIRTDTAINILEIALANNRIRNSHSINIDDSYTSIGLEQLLPDLDPMIVSNRFKVLDCESQLIYLKPDLSDLHGKINNPKALRDV